MVLQIAHAAVPHLHYREIRLRSRVIVIDVSVIESLAIVITETVHFHLITQPIQISFEHCLNLRIRVIPVSRSGIVRLVAITVIRIAHSITAACRRRSIRVHLIRITYIRAIRRKRTVRTKGITLEITPSLLRVRMVDHDICHHTCTVLMEYINQLCQLGLRSPVTVQVTIISRVITRSAGRFTHWRKPYEVKPLTDLLGTRAVSSVQMIHPFGTTINRSLTVFSGCALITIPVKRL